MPRLARQEREREREVDNRGWYRERNIRFVSRFRAGNTRAFHRTFSRFSENTWRVGFSADRLNPIAFSRANPSATERLRIRGSYLRKFIRGRSFYDDIIPRARSEKIIIKYVPFIACALARREIRLNVKIDSAVENAVAGTTLVSILISFSILIERLHVRAIRPAFRDMCRGVLLKIDDFHCVVFIIYRYVSVWSSGRARCCDTSDITRRIALRALHEIRLCINTEWCVNKPWLYIEGSLIYIWKKEYIFSIIPLYTKKISRIATTYYSAYFKFDYSLMYFPYFDENPIAKSHALWCTAANGEKYYLDDWER